MTGKNIYSMFGNSFLHDVKIGYGRSNKIGHTSLDDVVFRAVEQEPSGGSTGGGSTGGGSGGGSSTIQQIYPKIKNTVVLDVKTDSVRIDFDIAEVLANGSVPTTSPSREYRIIDTTAPVLFFGVGGGLNQTGVRIYYSTTSDFSSEIKVLILYKQYVAYGGTDVGYPCQYKNSDAIRQITGLKPSTTYYYFIRVDYYIFVGAKSPGYDTTTIDTFTTAAAPPPPPSVDPPSVNTFDANAITTNTATLNGSVTNTGGTGEKISERGFVYSTTQNPDINSQKVSEFGSFDAVSFSGGLTNLAANTTYYFKAYSKNSKGTSYGVQKSFATQPMPVILGTVKTNEVNSIGTDRASSGVTIQTFGSNDVSEYGIYYAPSENPWSSAIKISTTATIPKTTPAPRDMGPILITGLSPDTQYKVKAFIRAGSAYSYGDVLSFRTYQVVPVLNAYPPPGDGITWYQPYKNWEYEKTSLTLPMLKVSNLARKDITHPINYYFNATFSSNKNYQFRTIVDSFYDTYAGGYVGKSNGASFSMRTPWGESFTYPVPYVHSSNSSQNIGIINLYYYATLPERNDTYILDSKIAASPIPAQNPISYKANHLFGESNNSNPALSPADNQTEYLTDVRINELSWKIQGFSFYTLGSDEKIASSSFYAGKGWHYSRVNKKFTWFDRYSASTPALNIKPYYNSPTTITLNENDKNNPVGGYINNKVSHSAYRINNYIAKYIPYQNFNISFTYKCDNADKGIRIYLSQILPTQDAITASVPEYSTLIASLTQSKAETNGTYTYGTDQICTFVGLEGNQYFYIVADSLGTTPTTTTFLCEISNLRVSGGYHIGNNQRYIISSTSSSFKTNSIMVNGTYSALIGSGNTVNASDSISIIKIGGKIGNGNFKSGVWENGVWNNGWREDKEIREFYKIDKFISYDRDTKWQIYISGPESSVNARDTNNAYIFSVGDRVSISNIVAIDINENRKLLTKYFRIIEKSTTYLVVEFQNNFPLRRIEIDSPEHRIKITKNVWLSGTFFNGYFKGIWNYGLFAGYPFLTKMENSHWIDGIFSGGHFYAEKYKIGFSKAVISDYSNSKRLGLTFSKPHKLATGDIINILGSKNLGETVILSTPDEYSLITGIGWKKEYSEITGSVYSLVSSGLIQNFEFYAKNVSKNTSVQSLNSKNVFAYNSWIDVNYSDKSAVNIGKPQSLLDEISGKGYSENNLYGYPTTDVLSSRSSFRDSFSNIVRDYKLGTKYKIFGDYIGDSSKFEEYFESTDTAEGRDKFKTHGWDFSKSTGGSVTFSRTPEPVDSSSTTIGKELRVFAKGNGGVLNLTPAYEINNRINGEVDKLRYTLVEFEMLTYSVADEYYTDNNSISGMPKQPTIHFGNLNYVSQTQNGTKTKVAATYLPIYENINHLKTGDFKKQEFFFNKRDLLMNFRGYGALGSYPAEYYIDNLKLYEVDMVPFFQYFKNDNINKGIQNPYQVIAPAIDYNDSEETSDPKILSDYIDVGDISAVNGINWIEDIILRRYQVVSSEYDTDIEDIVSDVDLLAAIPNPTATTGTITDIKARSAKISGTTTNATTKIIYWGTDNNPIANGAQYIDESTGDAISLQLYDLEPNTQYHAVAYSSNSKGTATGDVIAFKTKTAPSITVNTPTGTNNNSTNVSGDITNTNGETITSCGFQYSTTPSFGNLDTKTATTVQSGSFNSQITGLSPGTTYYIRAILTYDIGNYPITSAYKSITTSNLTLPTLDPTTCPSNTTSTVNAVNTTIVSGTITNDGGSSVTERGFVYSTSPNPAIGSGTKYASSLTSLTYTYAITGLILGTTYYFRSYAINSTGTGYGAQVTVTIQKIAPILTTGSLGTPTANAVSVIGSNVANDGGSQILARGVVYGTSTAPTISNGKTNDGAGTGYFTSNISELAINTTYYVRAYATNAVGTSYGSEKSFATICNPPTVKTTPVFNTHIKLVGDKFYLYQEAPGAPGTYANVNYAQAGGEIISAGGSPILEVGLVWTKKNISAPTGETGEAVASISNTLIYKNNLDFTNRINYYGAITAYNNDGYKYDAAGNITNLTETETASWKIQMPYEIYDINQTNITFVDNTQSPGSRVLTETKTTGFKWTATMTGMLSTDGTISVRAYARNLGGIGYGADLAVTFSTGDTEYENDNY